MDSEQQPFFTMDQLIDSNNATSFHLNELNMDFIGNLMTLQEQQRTNLSSDPQPLNAPPVNQHLLLEQQFKLAQLQQLQQLQNQIFQQQV